MKPKWLAQNWQCWIRVFQIQPPWLITGCPLARKRIGIAARDGERDFQEDLYDRRICSRLDQLAAIPARRTAAVECTFDNFICEIKKIYSRYTPEFGERESGIPAATIVKIAREMARAGSAFAAHVWRSTASGNQGGWNVARCLEFLHVLTGSVGTKGGMLPNTWTKYNPKFWLEPPGQKFWNQLFFPDEYPLSHYEMSFLLPHFLKEGRGKLDVYFTRVYNPVWTNPDGFTWIEVLKDESKVGLHVALTPTWSETAFFADYILPMGHAGERMTSRARKHMPDAGFRFASPSFV